MNALKKLQAAIRKFLGLTKPPSPSMVMLDDPETGKPAATLILGHVTVKLKPITACNCPDCQRRRKAPWN